VSCHFVLHQKPPWSPHPPSPTNPIQAQFQSNCPLPHHIMVPAIYTKHNCMTVQTFDNGCAEPQDTLLERYGRQEPVVIAGNWKTQTAKGKNKLQTMRVWGGGVQPCEWKLRSSRKRTSVAKHSVASSADTSSVFDLTLILPTWKIRWAPNNARKWQMGFNWVFKPLIFCIFGAVDNELICINHGILN
jgi:hypothetical protein